MVNSLYGTVGVIDDCEFIAHIIASICDYAVDHGMHPNDVLAQVADNIIDLLKIATFNKWRKDECLQ